MERCAASLRITGQRCDEQNVHDSAAVVAAQIAISRRIGDLSLLQ